ncbi:MAG: HAMP domain-containing sensor histidine kinase [Bdellovibrionota bacterium]
MNQVAEPKISFISDSYEEKICDARLSIIGQNFAEIVHELRNPLAIADGFNSLILDHAEDKNLVSAHSLSIGKALTRVSDLIDQIYRFSRMNQTEGHEIQNLNQIVHDSISFFAWKIKKQKVVVRTNLTREDCLFLGSQMAIETVLANFLSNSLDAFKGNYTDNRTLTFKTSIESGNYAVLTYIDSAGGMSPAVASRLFDRYFSTKKGWRWLGNWHGISR